MLNFFARRKLRKQLSGYLSPEAVRDVLDGGRAETPKIYPGPIEFIFVSVRADTPERLAEQTGLVADTGIEHGAVVHDLIGPMVVMAFGTLRAVQHSPTSRTELVNDLQRRFRHHIRIVHGAVDGHFGLFGSEKRLSYTFTFPHFDAALATLGRLEFGQTQELPP